MVMNNQVVDYFQRIYIINLPERTDRRAEMAAQLALIGLSLDNPKVHLFPAIKPIDAGEFESIGARGCFYSHLAVLKDAKSRDLNRILIFEDDLNFSKDFLQRSDELLANLAQTNWDVFYGGCVIQEQTSPADNQTIIEIPATTSVMTAHFIGFQNEIISQLVDFLELLLSRKNGDPRGGPMHVDGAYSWFRNLNPSYKTLISTPEFGYQRSSRTDIYSLRWFDRTPIVSTCVALLRQLKNRLR